LRREVRSPNSTDLYEYHIRRRNNDPETRSVADELIDFPIDLNDQERVLKRDSLPACPLLDLFENSLVEANDSAQVLIQALSHHVLFV
jgi:hypothetical protein